MVVGVSGVEADGCEEAGAADGGAV